MGGSNESSGQSPFDGCRYELGCTKEAALAHVAGINNMDAKGVATKGDYTAILAGLGKAIASAPSSKVMDVYNAIGDAAKDLAAASYPFLKEVNKQVPNYLMS